MLNYEPNIKPVRILLRISWQFNMDNKQPHFGFRWLAKLMVWMSLFLSIALLIVGCVYCGFKYSEIKEENTDNDGVDDLIDIGFTTDVDEYLSLSS